MRFSVSLVAEGDREITLDEVVAFADTIAVHEGIASGVGALSYGAQIIVEAEDSDAAVDTALEIFADAAQQAGMPSWPVARAETIAEDEDFADIEDVP